MINRDKEKGEALIEYVENFADKVEAKETVELFEFHLLLKAYQWIKSENAKLKEELEALKNKEVS